MLAFENKLNLEREKFKKYSEENSFKNEEINNLKQILDDQRQCLKLCKVILVRFKLGITQDKLLKLKKYEEFLQKVLIQTEKQRNAEKTEKGRENNIDSLIDNFTRIERNQTNLEEDEKTLEDDIKIVQIEH